MAKIKNKPCKCNHPNIDFSAEITADGHKRYYAVCVKCKKDIDVVSWLVNGVRKLFRAEIQKNGA
jgi:hypothetical protein